MSKYVVREPFEGYLESFRTFGDKGRMTDFLCPVIFKSSSQKLMILVVFNRIVLVSVVFIESFVFTVELYCYCTLVSSSKNMHLSNNV